MFKIQNNNWYGNSKVLVIFGERNHYQDGSEPHCGSGHDREELSIVYLTQKNIPSYGDSLVSLHYSV